MATYYTFSHEPGYGSMDHLAPELIARAIRQLGTDTTQYVAASMGFVAHGVPMSSLDFRLPATRGAAAKMKSALRRARQEMGYVDARVFVERIECRRAHV